MKPWGFDIVESRNLFRRFVFLFSKVETVERFRRCRNVETLSKPLANQNRFRNHMFRLPNYFPPKLIKKNKKTLPYSKIQKSRDTCKNFCWHLSRDFRI